MPKLFILIAFASGILAGCVKTEGTLPIKGIVIDAGTKKGIPWKNIIIQGLADSNSRPIPIEAGQFSTDSSGYFTYTLKKIKGAYYYNFCLLGDSEYPVTISEMSSSWYRKKCKISGFFPEKISRSHYKNKQKKQDSGQRYSASHLGNGWSLWIVSVSLQNI